MTPIFKIANPKLVSKYRLILLLSLPSKLLEHIIHDRLLDHLPTNSLLSDRQFGFHPGSSMLEVLIVVTTDWHKHLDNKSNIATFFFNLSKAFDFVPHQGLLQSLANVGVSGPLLKRFKSYLSGRIQCVMLDCTSSLPTQVCHRTQSWAQYLFCLHRPTHYSGAFCVD